MKLRFSPTSPYVRKVMMLAHEAGLADRIESVLTDSWSADSDLAQDNPLGKVPALTSEDGTFVESPLVCEYLDSRHDGRRFFPPEGPARWQAQQFHALGNGILDSAVGRVIEKLRRPQEYIYPAYLDRQAEKIRRTLDLLETRAGGLTQAETIGDIAVACALAYLDFRMPELDWRQGRPTLAAWYAEMAERPSLKATEPPRA
jgi:glutathione S-transferase